MARKVGPPPKKPIAVLTLVSNVNGAVQLSTAGTMPQPGRTLISGSLAWGNGPTETWSGSPPATITHTYSASGLITAVLRVRDNKNSPGQDAIQIAVNVSPAPPLAPTCLSIVLADTNPTDAQEVVWTVTFSEAVTGVTLGAFTLSAVGPVGQSLTDLNAVSTSVYEVTADRGAGVGTLGLNFAVAAGITSIATGTAATGALTGERYTIIGGGDVPSNDFAFYCGGGGYAGPGTVWQSDGSKASVQAQIDAASHGDIICIPAGTYTWASPLSVTKALTMIGVGAGTEAQCDAGGQTSYTCVKGSSHDQNLITWTVPATGQSRVTGLTLHGGAAGAAVGGGFDGLMIVNGSNTPNFRFDHNAVIISRLTGMAFSAVLGVVDHNTFYQSRAGVGVYAFHPFWNGTNTGGAYGGVGDGAWASESAWGSEDFLFFEDNTMIAPDEHSIWFIDGWMGRRIVMRYNTLINLILTNHGTDSSARYRGARAEEYYRNTFCAPDLVVSAPMSTRGGAALVWGNTAITNGTGACAAYGGGGSFPSSSYDMSQLRLRSVGDTEPDKCSFWGCCDNDAECRPDRTLTVSSLTRSGSTATATTSVPHGLSTNEYVWVTGANNGEYNVAGPVTVTGSSTFTYPVNGTPLTPATGTIQANPLADWNVGQAGSSPLPTNSWDQGAGTTAGYACMDQVGRGKGDLISGDSFLGMNGVVINGTTDVEWPAQVLDPVYAFDNTLNGTTFKAFSAYTGYIDEDRDFYTNGSGSLGGAMSGVIASRPATCTTGQSYWATNEGVWGSGTGKMYLCTAPNTWSARYGGDGTNTTGLPYTYPHPLTQ